MVRGVSSMSVEDPLRSGCSRSGGWNGDVAADRRKRSEGHLEDSHGPGSLDLKDVSILTHPSCYLNLDRFIYLP